MLVSNAVSKSVESSTVCSLMPLSVTSVDSLHPVMVQHVQILQTLQVISASVVFDIKCCFWGLREA